MRSLLIIATLFLPTLAGAQSMNEAMRLDMSGGAQQSAPALETPPAAAMPSTGTTTAQAQTQANPDDKDHMLACAIIYQRISDMYKDRGEGEKADSFIRTAYAYSQTADILYTQEVGMEQAYDTITERMSLVSESLNRESQAMPNGDLGVIENWLGWCDERGEFVQNTIDSVNNP